MTRRLFHLGLLGVVLVAAAASYAVHLRLDPVGGRPLECARQWLTLSRQQCRNIRSEDPEFQSEAQALSQSLQTARQTMVNLIADVQTPDQALYDQAQVVLEAHHALMRRTIRHLMVIRGCVNTGQGVRLNALCSNAMRCGPGQGMGRGRQGHGMGMGMGMGRDRGSLGPALTLTDAQRQTIARTHPDYETQAADLAAQVRAAHMTLARTLQDSNSPDESIQQALEHFITVRTLLERQTVNYVLAIRPLLTPDQQQCLIGLSQRGCFAQGSRGPQ